MSRQYLVLIFLVMAAAAHARPAPDSQRLPEIDNGSLAETRAAVAPGAGYTGRSAAANAALDDTVMYGGTYWAADSLRWEAIRGGTWTFDTGVGSAFGPTGPNKPAGYHTLMEGWSGVDQGVNESPYFRRSATCAIAGTYSFWVGRTAEEINPLCWAAGQGYGNNWYTEIHKSFSYAGTGNVILSYLFRCDSEDGFDVTDVMVDTSGTGAARDIELISHTGVSSGLATLTLSPGTSLPRSARPIVVKFIFSSDGSYSDEDGMYPTACGAFAVDNISLTGAIAGFSDFEAGSDGWTQVVRDTGVGDFSNIVNRNSDLPAPLTFCACGVSDSVLVFHDQLGGHPNDQDNIAVSPWIDLKRGGDVGRPGKLIAYDIYAELPMANYIFVQIMTRWYPSVCGATGQLVTSPFRYIATAYYYGDPPYCTPPGSPRIREFSSVIEPGAEQIQIAIGLFNGCREVDWGPPCSGASNTTPWIDNVRLGVYGAAGAAVPSLSLLNTDYFQDNFATDGTLNPASTGRLDVNLVKNYSRYSAGTILGDTLCVHGDGGNTEVRLVFRVTPGPFTSGAALAAWAAQWTPEPSIGTGWYSARMDTAEQSARTASPIAWMSTFHELDPGFQGNDRSIDPVDQSQLENEILPDHILTPGARVDYFVAARFIPPDARNPSGTAWQVLPDTSGGRHLEVEILPSSMVADSTWNCTLYVNHHHDHNGSDHAVEEQALAASLGPGGGNHEHTRYDRWDVITSSSAQSSFGRPAAGNHGATLAQALGYRNIIWHSGTAASFALTESDARILTPWCTWSTGSRFWGSGDGLTTSMDASNGTPVMFMRNILGVTRTCDTGRELNCPPGSALDSTYCLPTTAVAEAEFTGSVPASVRGNGCYDLRSFDVIGRNTAIGTSRAQLSYLKSGAVADFASITNHNLGSEYKTVLDGFSIGAVRTTAADPHDKSLCTDTGAAFDRTNAILYWFGTSSSQCGPRDVTVTGVPDGEPHPRGFRTLLGNAWPNPGSRAIRISFTNGVEGGTVTLRVFDVTGRLVRTLVDHTKKAAGVYEATWDGLTDSGSAAPAGMYFYRLTTTGYETAKKLMVIR